MIPRQVLRPIATVGGIAAAVTPLIAFLPQPYHALGYALLAAGTAITSLLMQSPIKAKQPAERKSETFFPTSGK